MTKDNTKFTAHEYGSMLRWFMQSDPFPGSVVERERIAGLLNDEARRRGYDGWVDAYHNFESGDRDRTEEFDERLRYGDACPVCGEPVKAVVVSVAANGPRVYNGECSQHTDSGCNRYIFHQEQ